MRSARPVMLRALLVLLAVGGLVAVLEFLPRVDKTIFWDSVYDAGHAPLFGCMALLILALQRIVWPREPAPIRQYLIAAAIPVIIGIGIEVSQIWSPRDADPVDALHDAIGAGAFLLLFLSVDTRPDESIVRTARTYRWLLRSTACLLLLIPGHTPLLWGIAAIDRDRRAPSLCQFDSYWERKYIVEVHCFVKAVPPPGGFSLGRDLVAQVRYDTATWTYPTFILQEPIRDWRPYDSLLIDWHLPGERSYQFYLSIHDRWHNNRPDDRFNRTYRFSPGEGTIAVGLDEIQSAPAKRPLDMANMQAIKLFPDLPDTAFNCYFDNIRLK